MPVFRLPLLIALAALWGCTQGYPIIDVQVSDRARLTETLKVDSDDIQAVLTKAVADWPGFKLGKHKSGEPAFQVIADFEIASERRSRDHNTSSHRALGLKMSLVTVQGTPPFSKTITAEVLAEQNPTTDQPAMSLVSRAVSQASERILEAIRLYQAPSVVVNRALESTDLERRARAVVVARDRKLKTSVPLLMAMAKSKEEAPDLVVLAVGALVAIGDSTAVPALIDSAQGKAPEYLTQILFSVAALGGQQAEAYLFTVKSGHPNPHIRGQAEDALRELERGKKQRAVPGP